MPDSRLVIALFIMLGSSAVGRGGRLVVLSSLPEQVESNRAQYGVYNEVQDKAKASERFVPGKNQIIVVIVLLIIVFLAGFVPQYIKVKRLENALSVARQENALAQLRDLADLAFIQANQKNYGLAAGTSKPFFSRARDVANRAPDANGRKALEDLLASQDKITAELAKGDSEALGDLQALSEKTRQATGSIDR